MIDQQVSSKTKRKKSTAMSDGFLSIDPKSIPQPKLHGLLLSAVAPRPIAWASTISADGMPNLAPFSFFNVFSSNPPICIFSPALRGRDATRKHTLNNVEAVPEVVINVVNHALVEQCNLSSAECGADVNEFDLAGLAMVPSQTVRPFRVALSPVQLECKVNEVKKMGTNGGAGNLIICEVTMMHISDAVLDANGSIDQDKIDLVARLGKDHYCRASGDALFDIAKPMSNAPIGFMGLPAEVRNSVVLTGSELAQLANVAGLPSIDERAALLDADQMRFRKSLTDAKVLHKAAQALLAQGKVMEAWAMLL